MNKRQRKKQLKKLHRYVPNSELWNLDYTIADWIIPRLQKFRDNTIGYPGNEEFNTFEKWQAAIDKMIRGFEMVKIDPTIDDKAGLDLWTEDCHLKVDMDTYRERIDKYYKEQDECLEVFAKNISHLWW